jgi:hypothetical protein
MLVGCGDVGFIYKFFPSTSDALRNNFFCEVAHVGKNYNVEVKESACHYPALSERILGNVFRLLHIFYASARAIMVVIELMECSEIATKVLRPLPSI